MVYKNTTVETIGASGSAWVGEKAQDVTDLIFDTLNDARQSIQISTFTLGHEIKEIKEFFDIIEERLCDPSKIKVSIIVNDDGKKKNGSLSSDARKRLVRLENKFPEQFFPSYFLKKKTANGTL